MPSVEINVLFQFLQLPPLSLYGPPIDKTVLYSRLMIAGNCHDRGGVGSDRVSLRRHVEESRLPAQPSEEQEEEETDPRETEDCHPAPPQHTGRDPEGQGGHDAHQEGLAGGCEAL